MKHQENDVKETKKTRKKRSARTVQQIKLAVIMIMVSVLVLSASTFAWYQLSNTAKITNMQFTADTMGNLKISDSKEDGSNLGEYSDTLDLSKKYDSASGSLVVDSTKKKMLPSTSMKGNDFYYPIYSADGSEVTGVSDSAMTAGDGEYEKYVYRRVFYLKSGEIESDKLFSLKLNKGVTTQGSESGTYFKNITNENSDAIYAANVVRISFEFEDESINDTRVNTIKIYEPNCDAENSGGTAATNNVVDSYGPKAYSGNLIQQKSNGNFKSGEQEITEPVELCKIKEGTAMKVTMYVWFEGMDTDCKSEIGLDEIFGQIQFIAE